MHACKFSLLLVLFSCLCLFGYAQNNSQAYSALNGNWHLGGTGIKSIDFSFGVDGNKVYGEGYLGFSCMRGTQPANFRGDIFVEGSIAEDNSFVLTNPYSNVVPAKVLTIHGKLPSPGSDQWLGSFEHSAFIASTKPDPGGCQAGSGDFTAARLPEIRGAYTGTFGLKQTTYSQSVENPDVEGYVSLEIMQGGLAATRIPGEGGHVIAANGRATLTGSSKFPSGAYTAEAISAFEANSRVYGGNNFVLMLMHQNDGTEFMVYGEVDKTDENRIRVRIVYVSKDKDGKLQAAIGYGWLTRQ